MGQVHWSATAGASAGPSNPVVGSGAALVSTVGPDRGKALVMLDGAPVATVDLYAPAQKGAQMVWSTSLSPATSHTLGVVALGTHNAAASGSRVDYDALLLLK